ncbi:hypothetical protein [Hyalangium rubrum]|uniref:Uncharacterized protein n=1 Tax=Hyalangium rubrum TaxID=3103134 RepID=A0ABU5HEU7_9BACT|nr:hypothetical protein [Hyalangium sp. s54d21]MDY7231327.1 hypothetical protein [Hyalangium sp. s54d21]
MSEQRFQAVLFDPAQHFEQLKSWYQGRNEVLTLDLLPQTGCVVPGKAAAFVYRTDSSVAWLEGIIAAPGLEKVERSLAVDAVVMGCVHEAKRLGFKMLVGYTTLEAVVKRGERLGFNLVSGGFSLMAYPLGGAEK